MPNWIGDFVLALAVLKHTRHDMADAPALLLPPYLMELQEHIGGFDSIAYRRTTSGQYKESVRAVRRAGFERIAILPHSMSSAWFAFRCGIRRRRGIARELRGLFLTERLSSRLADRRTHLTSEYAAVLQAPPFDPARWEGIDTAGFGEYRNAVVFCPGAKYGPSKRWRGWRDLADKLTDSRIVILGGAEDAAFGMEIARGRKDRIINLAGETSLVDAARIIAEATAVVSNDSGLMHLAGFLGTPLVAIFGSTSPAWTLPLGRRSIVLYIGEPCSPCFKRTCRYGHYRCLGRISADTVFKSVHQVRSDKEKA